MKKIFFILLFPYLLLAQYSIKDSALIRTTFTREFDTNIINEYLKFNNPDNVQAALLSIANSNDSSFIKDITALDFNKYSELICFALGALGENKISEKFIYSKLKEYKSYHPEVNRLIETFGKVADKESAEYFLSDLLQNEVHSRDISLGIYNLYLREKISKETAQDILLKQSANGFTKYSAFALYRIDPPEKSKQLIEQNIFYNDHDINSIKTNSSLHYYKYTLPYLLGCLTKLEYFPNDFRIYKSLVNLVDTLPDNYLQTKVEIVKSLANYDYQNKDELSVYLYFLVSQNPNIARQAAISLKEIKLNENFKEFFTGTLIDFIENDDIDEIIKEEIVLSYIKIIPQTFEALFSSLKGKISKDIFYKAAAEYPESETAYNYLINSFNNESEKNQITILQAILNSKVKSFESDSIIFNSLNSTSPPLISIAAESIDSSFINRNQDSLQNLIIAQSDKLLNDPNFIESVFSLINLSKKISTDFYKWILNILEDSKLYSIKKFAYEGLNKPVENLTKNSSVFDSIWNYAFKYSGAEIITSKGSFTIKFLPEYAPISVGNFCFLSERNFYNGIIFHRVVPGFVIQAGDPTSTGWGGPGYEIISELSHLEFFPDVLGMASAGIDTEGSQWFVTTGYYPHLNHRYTIWADVISGKEIIPYISQNDTIISVKPF